MKAIIIDDEPDNLKLLALQLKMYCPNVEVIAECSKSEEGYEKIISFRPDLVFLDIEMPRMNGFELLEKVGPITFSLVFVTAYDRFAVKAFRYNAIDYLLKPIDTKELIEAVKKVSNVQNMTDHQLLQLKQNYLNPSKTPLDKIALPFQNGVSFISLENILYCESDNNYTQFYMVDGQKLLATRTLRDVQELLEDYHFLRIHRQYIVNLDLIKKLIKGDSPHVVMQNNQSIPVSRSHKEKLSERFGWL